MVFTAAIGAFAVNFFLNLGLLQRFDLSYFFPFQGLSVILIALAGAFVLKEKLTPRLTIGSIIISIGVILVSIS
jgi:drug/metabolite transporter (DMT)-like permease